MNGWVAAEKLGLPTSPPYLSLVSKVHNNNKKNVSFLGGVNFASGGAGIFNASDKGFVSRVLIFCFLPPIFVFTDHVLIDKRLLYGPDYHMSIYGFSHFIDLL